MSFNGMGVGSVGGELKVVGGEVRPFFFAELHIYRILEDLKGNQSFS
jgi:hypothetical protein